MESILIVDDDINLCTVLSEELSAIGYETSFLTGGEKVANFIKDKKIDLLLLDLKMPNRNGFDVLNEINNNGLPNPHPKVIVLTAYADVKSAIESARLGAADFISKPYDFDELLITIRKVLQSSN